VFVCVGTVSRHSSETRVSMFPVLDGGGETHPVSHSAIGVVAGDGGGGGGRSSGGRPSAGIGWSSAVRPDGVTGGLE